ncbi:degenerin mec-10-like [Watersipora subatra]|uniref:degenerin mec-10-like n=1 Tax=Watersipora subatra TaxID=2589382 RepID=UPI00355BD508
MYKSMFFRNSTEALIRLRGIENKRRDFIQECTLQGAAVSCDEILEEVVTEAGTCYQFNKNGSFRTSVAGSDGGIHFVLLSNLSDYNTGPFSYSEGFMYLLGKNNSMPLIKQHGNYLSPGVAARFVIQRTQFERMPPYADDGAAICFDAESLDNPLRFFKSYSYDGCYMECKTLLVIERCGCTDLHQPQIDGENMCLLNEMLECAMQAEGLRERVKQAATLNVYYGEISYMLFKEDMAYTLADFVANFGGTMGITLGASFLTVMEFIEFISVSLFRKVFYRDSMTLDSTEKELGKDEEVLPFVMLEGPVIVGLTELAEPEDKTLNFV